MENITAGTDELLEEGRHAVESWASAVETELRDLVNSHRKAMSSARGDFEAMREQKRRLREIADRLRQEMQNEAQKEQEIRTAIDEAKKAADDYAPQLQALAAKEKEKAKELAQGTEEVARAKKRNAQVLNEMTRGTLFFRRLGLDFVYVDDETLQFIFTQVDPEDPERQFSVDICVAGDNYQVKDCNPPLVGLDDYVADVNRTNDLALFLKRIRRSFQALAVE